MSSAILYLAIIAIWAGVLVPRWLRPAQAVTRSADNRLADARAADSRSADARAVGARSANARAAHARQREDADEPWHDSDSDTEPIPVVRPERDHVAWRPGPSTAAHRHMILQARRRMLVLNALLTAGAVGLTAIHVAAWWAIIPPGTMLGVFVLLLREAARTDATRARRLAAQASAVPPVRHDAVESAPAAEAERPMVAEPEPTRTAEVIDISARYGDQLYDQYADAAVRAVGD